MLGARTTKKGEDALVTARHNSVLKVASLRAQCSACSVHIMTLAKGYLKCCPPHIKHLTGGVTDLFTSLSSCFPVWDLLKYTAHLKDINFSYSSYIRIGLEMFLNKNKSFSETRMREEQTAGMAANQERGFPASAPRPHGHCCLITFNTCWDMFWGVGHN